MFRERGTSSSGSGGAGAGAGGLVTKAMSKYIATNQYDGNKSQFTRQQERSSVMAKSDLRKNCLINNMKHQQASNHSFSNSSSSSYQLPSRQVKRPRLDTGNLNTKSPSTSTHNHSKVFLTKYFL